MSSSHFLATYAVLPFASLAVLGIQGCGTSESKPESIQLPQQVVDFFAGTDSVYVCQQKGTTDGATGAQAKEIVEDVRLRVQSRFNRATFVLTYNFKSTYLDGSIESGVTTLNGTSTGKKTAEDGSVVYSLRKDSEVVSFGRTIDEATTSARKKYQRPLKATQISVKAESQTDDSTAQTFSLSYTAQDPKPDGAEHTAQFSGCEQQR